MNNRSLTSGIFYPEDETQLKKDLQENFLEYEDRIPLPAALFIPHAAYEYILPLMGKGFAPFTREEPKRIIILAPIHSVLLKEDEPKTIFLPSYAEITTTLGSISIDQDLCEQLNGVHQSIGYGDHYFDEETSIELALPPLQFLYDDFQVLPILAGDISAKSSAALSAILKPLIDEETLVVISANLTGWDRREFIPAQAKHFTEALAANSRSERPALLESYRKKEISSCGTLLFDALHRTGLCPDPWQLCDSFQPEAEVLIDDKRSTIYGSGYTKLEL